MDAFAAAIDVLFGDQNLATDAVYRVGGAGGGTAIRAVLRRPDVEMSMGDTRLIVDSVHIDVRAADVQAPAIGDTIQIGDDVYAIHGQPRRDVLRMVWMIEARAQ